MLSEKDSGGGGFCVKKPDRPMPAADCGCSGPTLVESCAAERVRRMRRGATPLGHGVTHMLGESLVSSIARRGIQAARAAQSAMALMGGGFGRHSVAPRFCSTSLPRSTNVPRRLVPIEDCCWPVDSGLHHSRSFRQPVAKDMRPTGSPGSWSSPLSSCASPPCRDWDPVAREAKKQLARIKFSEEQPESFSVRRAWSVLLWLTAPALSNAAHPCQRLAAGTTARAHAR